MSENRWYYSKSAKVSLYVAIVVVIGAVIWGYAQSVEPTQKVESVPVYTPNLEDSYHQYTSLDNRTERDKGFLVYTDRVRRFFENDKVDEKVLKKYYSMAVKYQFDELSRSADHIFSQEWWSEAERQYIRTQAEVLLALKDGENNSIVTGEQQNTIKSWYAKIGIYEQALRYRNVKFYSIEQAYKVYTRINEFLDNEALESCSTLRDELASTRSSMREASYLSVYNYMNNNIYEGYERTSNWKRVYYYPAEIATNADSKIERYRNSFGQDSNYSILIKKREDPTYQP